MNKERIDVVNNVLSAGTQYLCESIIPQLKMVTTSQHDLQLLTEHAKGSYLIYNSAIQSYTVIKHYFIPDKGNFYAIATKKNYLYGFFIDILYGLAQFVVFNKDFLKNNGFKSTEYLGITIGEIANEFHVPYVYAIPLLYKPKRLML